MRNQNTSASVGSKLVEKYFHPVEKFKKEREKFFGTLTAERKLKDYEELLK